MVGILRKGDVNGYILREIENLLQLIHVILSHLFA